MYFAKAGLIDQFRREGYNLHIGQNNKYLTPDFSDQYYPAHYDQWLMVFHRRLLSKIFSTMNRTY
jgi:hypothetical protein